jgi:hypothetical protein
MGIGSSSTPVHERTEKDEEEEDCDSCITFLPFLFSFFFFLFSFFLFIEIVFLGEVHTIPQWLSAPFQSHILLLSIFFSLCILLFNFL